MLQWHSDNYKREACQCAARGRDYQCKQESKKRFETWMKRKQEYAAKARHQKQEQGTDPCRTRPGRQPTDAPEDADDGLLNPASLS